MDDERVDLTEDSGAVVLSLEVARRLRNLSPRTTRPSEKCTHRRTRVDPDEAELLCLDCKVRLSPIEWIIRLGEAWKNCRAMADHARAESARLDFKRRVKCDKCGAWGSLYGSGADEKRRAATREARLADALERIAILAPEAVGKYAGEIARQALAARDPVPAAYVRLELAPDKQQAEEH